MGFGALECYCYLCVVMLVMYVTLLLCYVVVAMLCYGVWRPRNDSCDLCVVILFMYVMLLLCHVVVVMLCYVMLWGLAPS